MKLRGKWTRKHSYHTAGIMVAAFMVIAAAGFWMVRSLLLENAQRLGNELQTSMRSWNCRTSGRRNCC